MAQRAPYVRRTIVELPQPPPDAFVVGGSARLKPAPQRFSTQCPKALLATN